MLSSKSVQDVHGIMAPQVRSIDTIQRARVSRKSGAGRASNGMISPALIGKFIIKQAHLIVLLQLY